MHKVLLVENDKHLGIILKDCLEMNDYEVSVLREPTKTVENLLAENYDLIIMDKLMNGIDGTSICAAIRDVKTISTIPILMMSGLDGAKKDCIAAGANAFIAKPFEIESLLKCIEATMVNV